MGNSMPKLPVDQKAARSANPAAIPDAQGGQHGIALAPPAYGIDVADKQPALVGGAAIQRRAAPATLRDAAPGAPQPNRTGLPDALKTGIESLSGMSLDDVRVRYNSARPAQLQALAYTQGSEIHVAPGQARHLPHEAWHVVQQKQGRVRPTMQLKGTAINDDAGLEHEADVMGARAAQLQEAMHVAPIAAIQDHGLAAEADRTGQRAATHWAEAQAKMAVQRSAPVRMSAPIPAGGSSYRLVAGEGGHQVGSVMVHAKGTASIEVTDLGVDQAHREQGIGKLLIASAARTGLQLGKAKMALAAQDTGSGRLTQWYKRMGFAQVGVHQRGYPQLEAPIGRVLGGVAQRTRIRSVRSAEPQLHLVQAMKKDEDEKGPELPTANELRRLMTTGHNYGAHDTEWQLILRTLEGYESHDQISRMRIYPVIEFLCEEYMESYRRLMDNMKSNKENWEHEAEATAFYNAVRDIWQRIAEYKARRNTQLNLLR